MLSASKEYICKPPNHFSVILKLSQQTITFLLLFPQGSMTKCFMIIRYLHLLIIILGRCGGIHIMYHQNSEQVSVLGKSYIMSHQQLSSPISQNFSCNGKKLSAILVGKLSLTELAFLSKSLLNSI